MVAKISVVLAPLSGVLVNDQLLARATDLAVRYGLGSPVFAVAPGASLHCDFTYECGDLGHAVAGTLQQLRKAVHQATGVWPVVARITAEAT